jgi:anti-sigma B factor antagonist
VTVFAVERRTEGDVVRLILTGELDLAVVPQFEAEMQDAESASPRVLLIDLSALEFVDSSGLRSLVLADERAHEQGRRLAIVPGPPMVHRVFEITKLDRRLDFVEDPAAVSGPAAG